MELFKGLKTPHFVYGYLNGPYFQVVTVYKSRRPSIDPALYIVPLLVL